MVGVIHHDWTRQVATDITTDDRSLRVVLAKIDSRVSIYTQMAGGHGQDNGNGLSKVQRQLVKARSALESLKEMMLVVMGSKCEYIP
jgi:hypothetical protein